MADSDLFRLVQSGWPQVLAIFAIIWWSRKIDLRTKDHCERLDRHEARLRQVENSHHSHAIQFARMEETLSSIKLTLDRMHADLRDRERTIPPR